MWVFAHFSPKFSLLSAIIKSGTLADRRSSIDLLDGLDLDFLGNSLGDSFDGFEFDGSAQGHVSVYN